MRAGRALHMLELRLWGRGRGKPLPYGWHAHKGFPLRGSCQRQLTDEVDATGQTCSRSLAPVATSSDLTTFGHLPLKGKAKNDTLARYDCGRGKPLPYGWHAHKGFPLRGSCQRQLTDEVDATGQTCSRSLAPVATSSDLTTFGHLPLKGKAKARTPHTKRLSLWESWHPPADD